MNVLAQIHYANLNGYDSKKIDYNFDVFKLHHRVSESFFDKTININGINVINFYDELCPFFKEKICIASIEDIPLYTDSIHFSAKGAELVVPKIISTIRGLFL